MERGLRRWTAIWHPAYRGRLVDLLITGSVSGGLVYLENGLLQDLVQSLAQGSASSLGFVGGRIALTAGAAAAPFALLGAVATLGICRTLVSARRDIVSSRLFIRSRADFERQVLHHLLHREDAFYTQHSMGEILNRLEVDLLRVLDRRSSVIEIWGSLLIIGSNLLFFAGQDWRLSGVVVFICLLGTFATHQASKPVQAADQRYFEAQDRVKMDFEDYLKSVPEVQVGGLFGIVLRRFQHPQRDRLLAFRDWIRAYTRVEFSRGASSVLALLVTVLIVLIAGRGSTGTEARSMALIPVLIYSLPTIFFHATQLVRLRTDYKMAANSVDRLLEYDTGRNLEEPSALPSAKGRTEPASALEATGVTYQYPSSGGGLAGGIHDVTVTMRPGSWSAVVGGAGSGKSTLINVLLGRVTPQAGEVRGAQGMQATLMPQKVVLLDTTIRTNLLMGSAEDPDHGALSDDDYQLLEDVGLAAICRLKALDMAPAGHDAPISAKDLRELREDARSRAAGVGVRLSPFDDEHVDPRRPCIDAWLGGRTATATAISTILSRASSTWLAGMASSGLGDVLVSHARTVLDRSRNLLEIESYQDFAALSPEPVEESVWQLRRDARALVDVEQPDAEARLRLVRVALTSAPAEFGMDEDAAQEAFAELRRKFPELVRASRGALEKSWLPYDSGAVHPYLVWRDNLLFAFPRLSNQRQRRMLDQALLELMTNPRWKRFFVSQGVEFQVGRNGSRLSGGQGQLVALARAALRRTPLLVLDEPTSALDPASRNRVVEFLRQWRRDRIVITISHDPELVRHADELHVMSSGRHAGHGDWETLLRESEAFRAIFGAGGE